MDMFRSLRFRLPAFFLAGAVLAGLISTLIALGLFQDYTEDRLVAELRREARGLSSLYAEQAIRAQDTDRPYYVSPSARAGEREHALPWASGSSFPERQGCRRSR